MPDKQRGFTLIGWAMIIAIGSLIILCAIRMVPAYVENSYVSGALKFLIDNNVNLRSLDKSDIKGQLGKYATINSLGDIQEKSFKIKKLKDRLIINSVYEVRVPIGLNIDVVMTFKNQLDTANPEACCDYLVDTWDEK